MLSEVTEHSGPFLYVFGSSPESDIPKTAGTRRQGDQWRNQVTQIQVRLSLNISYGLVRTRRLQPTRLGVVGQVMQSDLCSMIVTSLLAWPTDSK